MSNCRTGPDDPRSPVQALQVVGDGAAGGGTTVVLSLSRGLAERGFAVTIATQGGSHLHEQASRVGFPVLALDFSGRRDTPRIARTLAAHLRAAGPAVVHAHGGRGGLPVALLPSRLRATALYSVHGFHYREKPPGVRHLAMMAERFCMQRSAATIFVSAHDQQIAREARLLPQQRRTQVIYNGSPQTDPAAEPPAFDIAFLGRLHYQKNPGILPRILEALRPRRPSLCIIGSGDYEEALRAQVMQAGLSDQVAFLGQQPHAEALRALGRARIMLLPSRWEGLPVSVIEAMHRAIPVVASRVGGTDELVVEGETGYLVPPADVQAYAERIGALLDDEALRQKMGATAMARARAQFSIDSQLETHATLYKEVMATSRGMMA